MGKVGNSIEQLDIILYQVISCKSKLDEIFRHLSWTSEDSRSVSIGVVSMFMSYKYKYISSCKIHIYICCFAKSLYVNILWNDVAYQLWQSLNISFYWMDWGLHASVLDQCAYSCTVTEPPTGPSSLSTSTQTVPAAFFSRRQQIYC